MTKIIEPIMSFIEPNDLRNPKLLNQIKEIIRKILSRTNKPIEKIPQLTTVYFSVRERPFKLGYWQDFTLATIDKQFRLCKIIFKTLSFKDDKLEFTLNKPFDIFFDRFYI